MKKLLLISLVTLSSSIYANDFFSEKFTITYTVGEYESCYDKFSVEEAQNEVNRVAKSHISSKLDSLGLTLVEPIGDDIFKLQIQHNDKDRPYADISRIDGTKDYFGYDDYAILSRRVINAYNESIQVNINIQGQEWGYKYRNFLSFKKTSNNRYDSHGRVIGDETNDMTCSVEFRTAIKVKSVKNSETGSAIDNIRESGKDLDKSVGSNLNKRITSRVTIE